MPLRPATPIERAWFHKYLMEHRAEVRAKILIETGKDIYELSPEQWLALAKRMCHALEIDDFKIAPDLTADLEREGREKPAVLH